MFWEKAFRGRIAVILITGVTLLGSGCAAQSSASSSTAAASVAAYETSYQEIAAMEEGHDIAPAVGRADELYGEVKAVARAAATSGESPAAAPAAPQNRKIIKTSQLQLETKEFDTVIPKLIALVNESGGYIENQSRSENSMVGPSADYANRSASFVARIPAEKLEEVVSAASGLCHLQYSAERADDISEQYFDSQARLDSLTLQEERLLEILSKAEKLEEVITLEQALSEVRYQIETLTASLRRMDSQVAYSTLEIELQEVADYSPTADLPRSFGEEISASLARSMQRLSASSKNLLFTVIESGPTFLLGLLCWAVVLGLVVLVVRFFWKRLKRSIHFSKKHPFIGAFKQTSAPSELEEKQNSEGE